MRQINEELATLEDRERELAFDMLGGANQDLSDRPSRQYYANNGSQLYGQPYVQPYGQPYLNPVPNPNYNYNYNYNNPYYNRQYYRPYYRPIPNNLPKPYHANLNSSKLAYYVSIELELFPGTSANPLQKAAVQCQSTFERIRESYAELFGYQYRPSPMNEFYAYEYEQANKRKLDKEKNSKNSKNVTEKKNTLKQNKTVKNRH
jgi:hypothetical protein